jgi:putrescine transport system ATP-binding protein
VNLIEGRVVAADALGTVIDSAAVGRVRAAVKDGIKTGDTVWVALRPEKLHVAREPSPTRADNYVAGKVVDIAYLGDLSLYRVRLDSGMELKAALANVTRLTERPINWDDRVSLTWATDAGIVLTR